MSSDIALIAFVLLLPELTKAQTRFSVSKILPATSVGPSPRSDHLAVVINSGDGPLLVVHGGRDRKGPKSDTWIYVVSKNQWTLLAPEVLPGVGRPPPTFGAVGGYRFVEGKPSPFLYVAFGMSALGQINREMWVMDFETFGWRQVLVDGHIPDARYHAIGSLERFSKLDGSTESALIISHGYGEKGLLSDTYKCSFHQTDPFHATWRVLSRSVGQYSTFRPHPMWLQANTFTANRDLVVFGGCYASQGTGGKCPHSDVWLLHYEQDNSILEHSASIGNESGPLSDQSNLVQWQKAPRGPGPRVGAAMCQGLSSFDEAYQGFLGTAVLYSGSHNAEDIPGRAIFSSVAVDGKELSIFSTQARTWIRERVEYVGASEERQAVLSPRTGMSMNIVKLQNSALEASDEYYLLFGGQDSDRSFSQSLLKISFDAFMQSDEPNETEKYISRPLVHGILMFSSWGILMVVGIGLLRYRRSKNGKPEYIRVHIICQIFALISAWVGLSVVRHGRLPPNPSFLHARLGTALVVLVTIQPLTGSLVALIHWLTASDVAQRNLKLRRGSFCTARRILTALHGFVGASVMFAGWINITLGLFLIMSPTMLWIHWIVFCSVLVILTAIAELGRDPSKELNGELPLPASAGDVDEESSPRLFVRPNVSNEAVIRQENSVKKRFWRERGKS